MSFFNKLTVGALAALGVYVLAGKPRKASPSAKVAPARGSNRTRKAAPAARTATSAAAAPTKARKRATRRPHAKPAQPKHA